MQKSPKGNVDDGMSMQAGYPSWCQTNSVEDWSHLLLSYHISICH